MNDITDEVHNVNLNFIIRSLDPESKLLLFFFSPTKQVLVRDQQCNTTMKKLL